jgi:hypothetical protein
MRTENINIPGKTKFTTNALNEKKLIQTHIIYCNPKKSFYLYFLRHTASKVHKT